MVNSTLIEAFDGFSYNERPEYPELKVWFDFDKRVPVLFSNFAHGEHRGRWFADCSSKFPAHISYGEALETAKYIAVLCEYEKMRKMLEIDREYHKT